MRRLIILSVVLVLSGCGDSSGRVNIIGTDEIPPNIYAPPSPAAAPVSPRDVNVFLVRNGTVESFARTVVSSDSAEGALTALLVGPSPQEIEAGATTAIPAGTQLLALDLSGGVASVDFSSEFEAGAEQSVRILQIAQVVYTLTVFSRIESVAFRIEGSPVDLIAADGLIRSDPVTRADYVLAPVETPAPVP